MAFFFRVLPLLALLAGCAHSTIIPFQSASSDKPKVYPATNPRAIGIYRSVNPFATFTEIGAITFQTRAYSLSDMYEQLRKDSAEYGAQAVVDVKFSKETHTEYISENRCISVPHCDSQGICTTENKCHFEQVPQDITTYMITGSMIRGSP